MSNFLEIPVKNLSLKDWEKLWDEQKFNVCPSGETAVAFYDYLKIINATDLKAGKAFYEGMLKIIPEISENKNWGTLVKEGIKKGEKLRGTFLVNAALTLIDSGITCLDSTKSTEYKTGRICANVLTFGAGLLLAPLGPVGVGVVYAATCMNISDEQYESFGACIIDVVKESYDNITTFVSDWNPDSDTLYFGDDVTDGATAIEKVKAFCDFFANIPEMLGRAIDRQLLAQAEDFQDMLNGDIKTMLEEAYSDIAITDSSSFSDVVAAFFEKALNCISSVAYAAADIDVKTSNDSYLNEGLDCTNTFKDARKTVIFWRDPLALDLNGDGIAMTSTTEDYVQFDLDCDGRKERIGWVNTSDGFLARAA